MFCKHRFSEIYNILQDTTETEKERILKKFNNKEMDMFMKLNVNYLRSVIDRAKRSNAGKLKAKQFLREIYGDYLDDLNFLVWLANLLQKNCASLSVILACEGTEAKPGRKMTPAHHRQGIYDFWKTNSDVSVHRSNSRHIVKIAEKNMKKQVVDLVGDSIKNVTTKCGPKKKAHRRITMEPYHVRYHNILFDT